MRSTLPTSSGAVAVRKAPVIMRTALALAIFLAAPTRVLGQGGGAGPLPTIDGYRLGDTWQAVGRLIPCRSAPNGLSEFDKVHAGAYYPELHRFNVEG